MVWLCESGRFEKMESTFSSSLRMATELEYYLGAFTLFAWSHELILIM